MFNMTVTKKKTILVEMDETTFEAVAQTIRMAVGDNIHDGLSPEKQSAILVVDEILYNTFLADDNPINTQ